MLEAVGHPVVRLERVPFGPLRLGDLPPGRTGAEAHEIEELRKLTAQRAPRRRARC